MARLRAPKAWRLGRSAPPLGTLAAPPRRSLVGSPVADIQGTDAYGAAAQVRASASEGCTLVAFLTTSCEACGEVWGELGGPIRRALPQLRTVVVTPSASTESARSVRRLIEADWIAVMSSEAWFALEVPGAPWWVVLGADSNDGPGRVLAEGRSFSSEQLAALVAAP